MQFDASDGYGLQLYVVNTDGGEYLLEAPNSKDARTRARLLGHLMDEHVKDIKRSEYKAICKDIKHG